VPQGFGQRTLLAAPPKSGKTHVLAAIGKGTSNYNNENVYTIVLMIAERPEEVAFFKQELPAALILSATFDQNSETQVRLAELANAHAQRMCEAGYDVILLVDSLTRLTRAYNDNSNSNKTMSGGLDPMALEKIKKFFGVGRRTNHGGSITIIGTCLTDTHSIMDDVILREMLGTSSSDLYLDKSIAERNLFPALDFSKSSTRNGYLLVGQEKYDNVCMIMRKINLAITKKTDIIALLKINLDKFPSNEEFINILSKA
jgi:transcription termination factor Rho